jgi:hypothetical protein
MDSYKLMLFEELRNEIDGGLEVSAPGEVHRGVHMVDFGHQGVGRSRN